MNHVRVFDTTLRDGEQSPGISLNLPEKVEIAEQLVRLGVGLIVAGFTISSTGENAVVKAIASRVNGPIIAALARVDDADIDRVAESLGAGRRPRIHTFIATSDIHMRAKLKMAPDEILRRYIADVEFSCEDATRSDPEYLVEVYRATADAGASTLNVPDTVGTHSPTSSPSSSRSLLRRSIATSPGASIPTTTSGSRSRMRSPGSVRALGRWRSRSMASVNGLATARSKRS